MSKGTGPGALLWAVLALAGVARADSITWVMDTKYSGSGTASGAPRVTIDDEGTPGDVKFIFDATMLNSTTETIAKWFFNTNVPLLGGTFSAITNLSGAVGGINLSRTFNTTTNAYRAGVGGYYDWVFTFASSGGARFQDGDKFSFTYTSPGVTAQSFNVVGLGGTAGPFKTALSLNGAIGGTAWVTASNYTAPPTSGVPEPGLAVLALLGITGGILARRRS